MILLAESSPNAASWWQFCLCVAALTHFVYMIFKIIAERRAMKNEGQPVHVAQPLEIKQRAQYAHRADVEQMKQEVARIMKAGDERQLSIIEAIHGSERRLLDEVKDLHERLNPVAELCKAHAAVLQQIEGRLSAHERARADEIQRINQRIDDAIRLASSKNKT